jgi:hypothetical protein
MEKFAVVISLGAEVKHHRPFFLVVPHRAMPHDEGLPLGNLQVRGFATLHGVLKDAGRVSICAFLESERFDAMVGHATAHGMKGIVPILECAQESFQIRYLSVASRLQALHPGGKACGIIDLQSFVRPKRGPDLNRGPQGTLDLAMVLKGVDRIIRRAEYLDLAALQAALGPEFLCLQKLMSDVPDGIRRFRSQLAVDPEILLELDVAPVKQRIAESQGKGSRPRLKLLAVRCITAAEPFRSSIKAHSSPFIMVAVDPKLRQISKKLVVGQHIDGQMAMIINDREVFDSLIEFIGQVGFQQELFGNNLHGMCPFNYDFF